MCVCVCTLARAHTHTLKTLSCIHINTSTLLFHPPLPTVCKPTPTNTNRARAHAHTHTHARTHWHTHQSASWLTTSKIWQPPGDSHNYRSTSKTPISPIPPSAPNPSLSWLSPLSVHMLPTTLCKRYRDTSPIVRVIYSIGNLGHRFWTVTMLEHFWKWPALSSNQLTPWNRRNISRKISVLLWKFEQLFVLDRRQRDGC